MRVHRWLGLVVGLLAIALALSGAVLACAPLIERIATPARYRISGETRLAAGAYAEAAYRRLRPGERIAALALEEGSSPVIVTLDRRSDRARRQLFLDPPTAQILASGWADGGAIGMVRRLHQGMVLSGVGRWIVAIGGIGTVLASLTGLWAGLFRRRAKPAARGQSRKEAPKATWHARIGLWSAIPVLAMTTSGIVLACSPGIVVAPSAPPVSRSALSVEHVVASARAWSRGRLVAIDWPTERSPDWTLRFEGAEPVTVKVADDTARAVSAPALALPAALSWIRRLHEGRGLPWIWIPLAALTGVLAIWVAATGLFGQVRRPAVRPARRSADR